MAATSPERPPVLDLQTLVERPKIHIDDDEYEILSPQELSVVDHQEFASMGRAMDRLEAKNKLTDKDKARLSDLLTDLSDRIMVDIPDEIRRKLNDNHRLAVIEAFTNLPLAQTVASLAPPAGGNRKTRRAKQSTGAKKRPASRGSTAGPRGGGSSKRPSRSSAPT